MGGRSRLGPLRFGLVALVLTLGGAGRAEGVEDLYRSLVGKCWHNEFISEGRRLRTRIEYCFESMTRLSGVTIESPEGGFDFDHDWTLLSRGRIAIDGSACTLEHEPGDRLFHLRDCPRAGTWRLREDR